MFWNVIKTFQSLRGQIMSSVISESLRISTDFNVSTIPVSNHKCGSTLSGLSCRQSVWGSPDVTRSISLFLLPKFSVYQNHRKSWLSRQWDNQGPKNKRFTSKMTGRHPNNTSKSPLYTFRKLCNIQKLFYWIWRWGYGVGPVGDYLHPRS